ncbi:SLC13 family permease [Microbacterium sp. TNHR37B]|uniref:SLC13 family permease n=1 Tax=Microbacterium sp. TNHR37B TaxID=1775956 RepID=UPI0008356035|nr:SLC13 family permease [Microbacterium sp. TNHR37B]
MMDPVKLVLVGSFLILASAAAVMAGVLPLDEVAVIAERVWPILVFVVAVTVVAELASIAGVFDVAAGALARLSRGRTIALWLLVVTLATASTAFLSLDTTAVLLTPVVVAVARANGLSPLPFAFATVWLANTASLVLPVSNLTNLLAVHRLGGADAGAFIGLLGPSAAIAVGVTVALLLVVHRRDLRGRFLPAAPPLISDRLQLRIASLVVVVLAPLLVVGVEPWIPATAGAIVLLALFAWRSPRVLRFSLVPWSLLVFAIGLFVAVGALEQVGLRTIAAAMTGTGESPLALWQMSGVGMLTANAVNNLPAYVALEGAADTPRRLAALLIGVNAGPLITPWASLATLLWHQRLTAVGVHVPWRTYVLWGLVAAPLTVAAAVVPLTVR